MPTAFHHSVRLSAFGGPVLHEWHRLPDVDAMETACGLDTSPWGRLDSYRGPGSPLAVEPVCGRCWPSESRGMRRFFLDRQTDVSGTSGTGAVVEGVQFADGSCVVHWLTHLSSISVYKSIEDVVAIHGHEGSTNLHWVDEEPWAKT